MALSIKKQHDRAWQRYDAARSAVYALAPTPQTVFSECLKLAAPSVAQALDAAEAELLWVEREAVAKGKAWRGGSSHLYWY